MEGRIKRAYNDDRTVESKCWARKAEDRRNVYERLPVEVSDDIT
jgi:hypothetical protein